MIHGIGAPKFYIYDSTGVTLQKTITLSSNILADKPIIDETRRILEFPYTKTRQLDTTNQGYHYRQTLTAGIGDYNSTLLQYQADQANDNRRNDIFKLQQVLTYCNAGYVIKYTPHADLEDLWGFTPLTVFVTLEDLGYTGTNKTDSITVTVEGTTLTSSAFLWYEFSFTELNGVSNTNQCIYLNGSNQYLSCTDFDLGTTHSIEFWTKDSVWGSGNLIMSGGAAGTSFITITSTEIQYQVQSGGGIVNSHSAVPGNLNHWFVVRSGATMSFYLNSAYIGGGSLAGGDATKTFHIMEIGRYSVTFFGNGKFRAIRGYNYAATAADIKRQYNSGNGNWPLDVSLFCVYEFDGTGGTQTPLTSQKEDNQEGTATRDLTGVNSPVRSTL